MSILNTIDFAIDATIDYANIVVSQEGEIKKQFTCCFCEKSFIEGQGESFIIVVCNECIKNIANAKALQNTVKGLQKQVDQLTKKLQELEQLCYSPPSNTLPNGGLVYQNAAKDFEKRTN